MKDGSILEVTALFEDTLLSTTALGRRRRAAWPLVLLGALGIVAAGLAIAHGVGVAGWNERAAAFAGSPRAFRPERIGGGWDAVVVVGLVGGLGLILVGLLRRQAPRQAYLLGGTGSDLPVAGLDRFPLVARRGDEWVFARPDGMIGEVVADGVARPLPEAVVVARGLRVRGVLGQTTFFVAADAAARPRVGAPLGALDERTLGSAGVSGAVHAAIVLLLVALPGERLGFGSDVVDDQTRTAVVRMRPPEDPKIQPGQGGRETGGGAAALAGEAGTAGRPDGAAPKSRMQIEHRRDGDTQVARPAPHHGNTAGILAYFHTHEEAFEAVTSDATFSTGIDERDAVAWNGPIAGDAFGAGVGPGGAGDGGGGPSPHTIGPGRYRTIPGPGPGPGPGTGPGSYPFSPGGPVLGPRKPRPIFTIGHVVEPPEGLDPNVIRRYLRQRSSEIAYCYEKELVAHPTLAGMVTARFAIGQDGRVVKADVGGLGDPVDGCIAEVLRTIQFPRSQNVYAITYPFAFHAAGM
jgi:hypothetical protein